MTLTILDKDKVTATTFYASDDDDTDYRVLAGVAIVATDSAAFDLRSNNHDLEIRGFVSGVTGVKMGDAFADFGNRLHVTAGADVFGSSFGVDTTGSSTVLNEGEIRGNSVGVRLVMALSLSTVTNHGEIFGGVAGVSVVGPLSDASVNLTNTGTIHGVDLVYAGAQGVDRVTNTGEMRGNVYLGEGQRRLRQPVRAGHKWVR